jgi:hypothetical protein
MKFLNVIYFCVGHFCPPGSGSGSTDLIESEFNPDHWILIRNTAKKQTGLQIRIRFILGSWIRVRNLHLKMVYLNKI